MTQDIVSLKEKAGAQGEHDFLDRILAEKERLTETQIRDNVFMMFLAGHEVCTYFLLFTVAYSFPDNCRSSYLGIVLSCSTPRIPEACP